MNQTKENQTETKPNWIFPSEFTKINSAIVWLEADQSANKKNSRTKYQTIKFYVKSTEIVT